MQVVLSRENFLQVSVRMTFRWIHHVSPKRITSGPSLHCVERQRAEIVRQNSSFSEHLQEVVRHSVAELFRIHTASGEATIL